MRNQKSLDAEDRSRRPKKQKLGTHWDTLLNSVKKTAVPTWLVSDIIFTKGGKTYNVSMDSMQQESYIMYEEMQKRMPWVDIELVFNKALLIKTVSEATSQILNKDK